MTISRQLAEMTISCQLAQMTISRQLAQMTISAPREIKVHHRVLGVLHDYPVFARGVGKDAAIQDLGASSTAPQQTSKDPRGRRRSSVSIRALTLSLNEYIALLSHHLITMKTHNYKFDASYHVSPLNPQTRNRKIRTMGHTLSCCWSTSLA
jgi:hypothetical protein